MKRNLTFILLSKDPTDSKEITRALSNHPGVSLLMMTDDPQQAFTETARLRPTALIINFAQIGDPGLKLVQRSEEHTSELQSQSNLVCRLLLEKKKNKKKTELKSVQSS